MPPIAKCRPTLERFGFHSLIVCDEFTVRRDDRRDDPTPSVWQRVRQSGTDDVYFWNTETNATSWHLPAGEDPELVETIEAEA